MRSESRLRGDWASHEAALFACERWHYSECMPAGKLVKVGVWEDGRFIGVVLFGRGANNHIGTRYNLAQTEVCELVRVALTRHTAPVSQIVALAVRMLLQQSPGLRLIVSYADPAQGHHGGIYQAGNWLYMGSSEPQRAILIDGVSMHKRTADSKYGTASPQAIARLTGARVTWGPIEWKHTYVMPLDAGMRNRVAPLAKPYPKRQRSLREKQAMAVSNGTAAG
ncbi:hypothetical protein ACS7SF_02820 [Ralstonia sp. 25C]|uniref:Mom family adenine methylcarbamoylation protein n=1 Tax=Ralstonia sp. 25C TaxID=3447363 RepID=UPI003F753E54